MRTFTEKSLVRLETKGGVATLTLCRAEMHNALVPELLEALLAGLQQIHVDARLRAVVLAAEGPVFSLGGDMRRFVAEGQGGAANLRAYAARLVGLLNQSILALAHLPQPLIGAVQGTVTGGALGLVAACDLVVMADSAVLKAHYATAGFAPDGGWTACLPQLIGSRRAAAALLLNRSIAAEEALAWGLVNELAFGDEVLRRAQAMAEKIAAYPAGTMLASKRLLARDTDLAEALEDERRAFLALVASDDAMRLGQDFLERFRDYPGGSVKRVA